MGGTVFQLVSELMNIGLLMGTFGPFICTGTYFVCRNSQVYDDLFHYDNWCTVYDCAWPLYYTVWFWRYRDWVAVFIMKRYFDNCGGSELIASLTGMCIIGKVFAFLPEFGVVNSCFRATHWDRVR